MPRSASKNSDKSDSPKERTRKSDTKNLKSKKNADEDSSSDSEQSPQDIYDAAIIALQETEASLREQIKALPGIVKRARKNKRKAGTANANNAFTRQMGIPPPLIPLLRNPEDGKKLNKKSTLARPKLMSAILTYCKKNELGTEKGFYKPDEALREALGLKKKDTFNSPGLQKVISAVYKEHNIVAVPSATDDSADTGKKSKRQLKDDGSDSEGVQSEQAETKSKKSTRKRSNA